MESIYDKLTNKMVGEKEVIVTEYGKMYEFIKIGYCKYLIIHSIEIDDNWIELTTTVTTIMASKIYERLTKKVVV